MTGYHFKAQRGLIEHRNSIHCTEFFEDPCKLLSDNRELYVAQSAATKCGSPIPPPRAVASPSLPRPKPSTVSPADSTPEWQPGLFRLRNAIKRIFQ